MRVTAWLRRWVGPLNDLGFTLRPNASVPSYGIQVQETLQDFGEVVLLPRCRHLSDRRLRWSERWPLYSASCLLSIGVDAREVGIQHPPHHLQETNLFTFTCGADLRLTSLGRGKTEFVLVYQLDTASAVVFMSGSLKQCQAETSCLASLPWPVWPAG